MAEAYCVKDKQKVEVQNPQRITMKNGKPALPGDLPDLRRQGLQDRRLTARPHRHDSRREAGSFHSEWGWITDPCRTNVAGARRLPSVLAGTRG